MKKSQKVLGIIVILIIIGFGIFYKFGHSNQPTEKTSTSLSNGDLALYKDAKNNFVFKYPATWKITESGNLLSIISPSDPKIGVEIRSISVDLDKTLNSYIKSQTPSRKIISIDSADYWDITHAVTADDQANNYVYYWKQDETIYTLKTITDHSANPTETTNDILATQEIINSFSLKSLGAAKLVGLNREEITSWIKDTNNSVGFSFYHPNDVKFAPLNKEQNFHLLTSGVVADVPSSYLVPNSFQRSQKIFLGIASAQDEESCTPTTPSTFYSKNPRQRFEFPEFDATLPLSSYPRVTQDAYDYAFYQYSEIGDCAMDGCSIGDIYTTWKNNVCYEVGWFAIQSNPDKTYEYVNGKKDPRAVAVEKNADQSVENIKYLTLKILSTFSTKN